MKGKINIQPIPESRLKEGYSAYLYEEGYLFDKIDKVITEVDGFGKAKSHELWFGVDSEKNTVKHKFPAEEAYEFFFTYKDKIYPLDPSQWHECLDNDWAGDRNHELTFEINANGFAEIIPEPIQMGVTQRGFSLGEFEDDYRQKCTIQMSSIATRRCIWLGVSNMGPLLEGPDGSKNYDINARMHLSREHVKRLLPLLTKFAETGDL